MKLGMNMLLWSDDVRPEKFRPIFARLKALGYDGVEIPIFEPDVEGYQKLGQVLDDIGLARTVVNARRAEHDPISPSAKVRKAGIAQMRGILESARALGARIVAGPLYAALGVFSGQGPSGEEWQRGVDSVVAMADDAEEFGITLALEFLNRFEIYLVNSCAEMDRFVRAVERPACCVLYDTFHANIEEKSVDEGLAACASTLGHVHISENDRSTPGRGQVRWEETFAALARMRYDGWLTVEAFGTGLPALAAATKIWRRMFLSEDQLAADAINFMRRSWERARDAAPAAAPQTGSPGGHTGCEH